MNELRMNVTRQMPLARTLPRCVTSVWTDLPIRSPLSQSVLRLSSRAHTRLVRSQLLHRLRTRLDPCTSVSTQRRSLATVAAESPVVQPIYSPNNQPPTVGSLSETIAKNTAIYESYLKDNGYALPSHDAHILQPSDNELPNDIISARDQAVEASQELNLLLGGPARNIIQNANEQYLVVCLNMICRHDFAKRVPLDGKMTVSELADRCGLHVKDVSRILRCAQGWHVFTISDEGVVTHTAASRVLRDDEALKTWVEVITEWVWSSAPSVVNAMEKWPASQNPAETPWCLAHRKDVPAFTYWNEKPEVARKFSKGISYWSTAPGYEPSQVLSQFDFSVLPKDARWVDVGGSHGLAAQTVARAHPQYRCIVQDLAPTINSLPPDNLPQDLSGQVKFMAHDFFEDQPVKDVDVFFFRGVMHDWSDEMAAKILSKLATGMKKGTRVIISDPVLPKFGEVSMVDLRGVLSLDMSMKVFNNANERTEDDWKRLFRMADSRFGEATVVLPRPPVKLGLIVATWQG